MLRKLVLKNLSLFVLLVLVLFRTYLSCTIVSNPKLTLTCESLFKGGGEFITRDTLVVKFLQSNLDYIRNYAVEIVKQTFPSPHSELLLGVLLGIDDLKSVPRFNDVIRSTGTIHVVVVSGYNISLVFLFCFSILGGNKYKLRNVITAQVVTCLYVILVGFEPPVVRALLMGSLAVWAKYYGRNLPILQILGVSALLMVFYDPAYLLNLSFQLSFFATLSLIIYSDYFNYILFKYFKLSENALFQDLSSTLAAQILVWPLLAYNFSQVSVISPLVNFLVLWTISLVTILGGLFLLATCLHSFFGHIVSFFVYVPLDIFVSLTFIFSSFSWGSVAFKMTTFQFFGYYGFMFVFTAYTYPLVSGFLKKDST